MTLKEFKSTLGDERPDPKIGDLLCALWWQAKNEWNQAHGLVQNLSGSEAKWIHAHLHRIEGDLDNSRYWYSCAGRDIPTKSLEDEWEEIAVILLEQLEF